MPIFLQKISDESFNANGDFHVKESKGCNLGMGVLLLVLASVIIFADLSGRLSGPFIKIFYLLLVPAVLFIRRGSANQTVMTINKTGFFYGGQLLTSWDNFIDAAVTQEEKLLTIQDNFLLFIKYYKDGSPGYFGRKIPLTNTQDKAEEEIIAAIRFYYKQYQAAENLRFEI
jgi:hypothetical protein